MKTILAILALAAVASATTHVHTVPATVYARAPAHDSAVIKSDRVGGNFAYSVAENHAYAAHTPVVQHVQTPVAVSYTAGVPSVYSYGVHAANVDATSGKVVVPATTYTAGNVVVPATYTTDGKVVSHAGNVVVPTTYTTAGKVVSSPVVYSSVAGSHVPVVSYGAPVVSYVKK